MAVIDQNDPNRNEQDVCRLVNEFNSNVTRFIISFNIFYVITNILSILIFAFWSYFNSYNNYLSSFGVLLYDFVYLVKHGSLFYFFIIFNRNFRKHFIKKLNKYIINKLQFYPK